MATVKWTCTARAGAEGVNRVVTRLIHYITLHYVHYITLLIATHTVTICDMDMTMWCVGCQQSGHSIQIYPVLEIWFYM